MTLIYGVQNIRESFGSPYHMIIQAFQMVLHLKNVIKVVFYFFNVVFLLHGVPIKMGIQ